VILYKTINNLRKINKKWVNEENCMNAYKILPPKKTKIVQPRRENKKIGVKISL
jgi:hypothetical protein